MVFPGLYSPFFVCKRYECFVYKNPNIIDRILSMCVCVYAPANEQNHKYIYDWRAKAGGWALNWVACVHMAGCVSAEE